METKAKKPAKEKPSAQIEDSLDVVRDILFGQQNRANDQRLDKLHLQLKEAAQQQADELAVHTQELYAEISQLKQLIEQQNKLLSEELKAEVGVRQKAMTDLEGKLTGQLIAMQQEQAQQIQQLRTDTQQMLQDLDEQKAPRQLLAETFLAVGKQLQEVD